MTDCVIDYLEVTGVLKAVLEASWEMEVMTVSKLRNWMDVGSYLLIESWFSKEWEVYSTNGTVRRYM